MGGKQFLVSCTISMNGCGVALSALADTGANGYLFVNRTLSVRLSEALGVKILPLPYTVPIRGFQNSVRSHASYYMRLYLIINDKRVYNYLFVVLNLRN
jgi:hypothetical protein